MSVLKSIALIGTSLILLSCDETGNGIGRGKTGEFFKDPKVIELINAAANGDIRKIDLLVKQGVDVNTRGKDNMTPLLWMLQSRNREGFKCMLEHGADPNVQAEGRYSVMWFVAGGDAPEFLKLALEHGGNPDLVDPYGKRTLILESVEHGRMENVKLLIVAGANLNFQDGTGTTPLHGAAYQNYYDIIYVLLQAGADYRIKNTWDNTFVWTLEHNNIDPKSEGYKWRAKVIEFLRTRGVEVHPHIP